MFAFTQRKRNGKFRFDCREKIIPLMAINVFLGICAWFSFKSTRNVVIDVSVLRDKADSPLGSWEVRSPIANYDACYSEETVLQFAARNGIIRRQVSVRELGEGNSTRRGLVALEAIAAHEASIICRTLK